MNAGAGCIVPSLKFKVESWRWKSRPQVELVQGNGFRVHDLCEVGSFNTMFDFAATPFALRCFSQRAALAFFALAAFAAEPFPALPPRRPIAARYFRASAFMR